MTPALACRINEWQSQWVYKDGARGPVEIDCWGLVLEVSQWLGTAKPFDSLEIIEASKSADYSAVKAVFADHVKAGEWQTCDPETGAVAFFGEMKDAIHAGICIGGGVLDISAQDGVRFRRIGGHDLPKRMEYARWVG